MSLLEQDTTKKKWINKFLLPDFKVGDNKKYKVKAIQDSVVSAKKADGYLLKLYYLII